MPVWKIKATKHNFGNNRKNKMFDAIIYMAKAKKLSNLLTL